MSYTGTKAQMGLGASLTIGTSPAVLIGEIADIKLGGRKNNFEDATNLQSTAEEFISTIASPGEWEIEMNRVSSDAGQAALEAARANRTLSSFTVTLPKATGQTVNGDTYTFTAYVESYDIPGIGPKKVVKAQVKLKVSNDITLTVGS